MGKGKVGINLSIVGVDLESFLQAVYRSSGVPLFVEGISHIVIRLYIIRLDLDRLCVAVNRPL